MDGVIVDSTPTHTEAWVEYLRRYGIEHPDVGSRMLGKHNNAIVRSFFAEPAMTDEMVFEHGARKEQLYRELMGPRLKAKLVGGVSEFLEQLNGIPAAVATNAEAANVSFVLDRANLRRHFRVILSGDDVSRPKPAPDIFLRAASLLQAEPRCCIVFEDSLTGVEAARAANMRVVGVSTTVRELPGVDFAIRDFQEPGIREWLSSVHVAA